MDSVQRRIHTDETVRSGYMRVLYSLMVTESRVAAVLAVAAFVMVGCGPSNHPPQILDMAAERETVLVSSNCLIECVASDPDGDELSYKWYAVEGKIEGSESQATWQAPSSPGIYTILVTVQDGQGKEVYEHLSITVKTNLKPRITNLSPGSDWVPPSGTTELYCSAEDPDGATLSYVWSADAGEVSGGGARVHWSAPPEVRLCQITVIVRDEAGAEDQRSLVISVASGPPPQIKELQVIPEEPRYVKQMEDGAYRILKGQSCRLECIIDEPRGQLQYEWVENGGKIFGEGSSITWTAPNERGTSIVTVVVSDEDGNTITRSVAFGVETCGCAFR